MSTPDGLLIVDKPRAWTSHDVVARCRRLAGTRRVGHAGTLDPMATGVLVLGIGRATRLLGHLALTSKEYDATIRLGQATTTDDGEGERLAERDAAGLDDAALDAAVKAFTGDIRQRPSSVSAVKLGGRRAYALVRAGERVDIPARPVTVSAFDILGVRRLARLVDVDVHVECTTGTYVRALARDLGESLGVGGHLTALRRTRVGPYTLEMSHGLERLDVASAVIPIEDAAAGFPTYTVAADLVAAVRNGRQLTVTLGAAGPVALTTERGEFLALYEQHGPVAKAVAVFSPG